VEAFRKAVEAQDLDAAIDCFADDALLHSPVLFRPFEGKGAVRLVLSAVLNVLEDFHYTDELSGDGQACLVFRARIGERKVEGMDLIRLSREGKIADFTVMMRPLSALNAFSAAMAEQPTLVEALARRGT
jgi:SnoaL-like protein